MEITFRPTLKQHQTLQYLNDNLINEVLYGGGARGGKSYLGCVWIILKCLEFPGSAWLIGRNELKRLKATTLITFFEVIKQFNLNDYINYNAQDSTITFKNGSLVFLVDLSYQPSDPNYDRIGSYSLTGSFIDEAQEINEKAINVIKGRFSLLQGEKWKTIPKALYTCNPSKGWIKTNFYDKWKAGKLESNKQFIPSLVTDNPYISEEYIKFLQTADKITIERLLKGNFDYDDTPGKLFNYDSIIRLFTPKGNLGQKYITCDVARLGEDKAVILVWHGMTVIDYKVYDTCLINELHDTITMFIEKHQIQRENVICDSDGVGGGLVDMLRCRGFVNNATPFDTRTEQDKALYRPAPNYQNLKTQCYYRLKEYLDMIDLSILEPYKTNIIQELDVYYEVDIDKEGKRKITPKEIVKQLIGRSSDFSDAIMFRMFYTLIPHQEVKNYDLLAEYKMYLQD